MCSKVHVASSYSLASMYNSISHFPIISTFIPIPLILIPIPLFPYHFISFPYHPFPLIPIPLSSSFPYHSHPHSHTTLNLIPIPLFLIPTLIACPQCYVTRWNVLLCIRHSVSATGQVRVSQSALLRQPCGDNIQVYESPHMC